MGKNSNNSLETLDFQVINQIMESDTKNNKDQKFPFFWIFLFFFSKVNLILGKNHNHKI